MAVKLLNSNAFLVMTAMKTIRPRQDNGADHEIRPTAEKR
jgi:hypothetical protein